MLVYGDAVRHVDPRDLVRRLGGALEGFDARPPGLARHAALVGLFILAGELTQGLADHAFQQAGHDGDPGPHDAAMILLLALAGAVGTSWRSGFTTCAAPPLSAVKTLAATPLPRAIETRTPEGYAFYAVYPEGWFEAASALGEGPVRVIGIRSIGTGLAAMLAAATGAPPPLTVRPFGSPFRREIRVAPEAVAAFLDDPEARIAIADEGPGLSGSSFASIAVLLESHGVDPLRLHLFPSHGGSPGPEAEPAWQARWTTFPRHVVDFDTLARNTATATHRLETWMTPLLGEPVATISDISGDGWRAHLRCPPTDLPPVDIRTARRKFLIRTAKGATWLAKFAGLGRIGAEKFRLATALHMAGYVSEPRGLAHGFLVERWIDEGSPLSSSPREDRDGLIAFLGRYLGFRAKHFPADLEYGASLEKLALMAQANAAICLPVEDRASFEDRISRLGIREGRRVRTDNRLHLWEWLRTPEGGFVKTDALDHHAAHDLVGCQDIAWDIAGAACEFDLGEDETTALIVRVEAESGSPVDSALVEACGLLYPAFQFGAFKLAAEALPGSDETIRLTAQATRYATRLCGVLR